MMALGVAVQAHAQELPFYLTADDISYDQKAGTISASGNVDVMSDQGAVQAKSISYDQNKDILVAEGDVLYLNPQDVAVFADRVELTGGLKTGAIDALRARLKDNGPAMTARRAEKTGDSTFRLQDASYSACPCDANTEDSSLPWVIRAKEITYDSKQETVTYQGAKLEVYGATVVKMPKFSHSVGKKKGRSGLLPPRFGRSSSRGEETTLTYYRRFSDQEDLALRSRVMSNRGVQAIADSRYLGTHIESDMRGSIIADTRSSILRTHLEGAAEYVVRSGSRLGVNTLVASDDTYLDDYFERNPSYLPTTAYAENASDAHYAAFSSTFYQDTRASKDPGQTALPLARGQVERTYSTDAQGGQLTVSADAQALHRGEGVRSRRVVSQMAYNRPYLMTNGQLFDVKAVLRGDMYNVDGTTTEPWIGRVLPEVALGWQQPWTSPGGSHVLTPQVMAIASPPGGNPTDIPNEDSVAYELDAINLFNDNRFAGFDRVETGPRLVYGLNNELGNSRTTRYRLFFGQSYRFTDEAALPRDGGTATRGSDYVGFFSTSPMEALTIHNRFRLDNSDLTLRRFDTGLNYGDFNKDYLAVTHTFLDGGVEELSTRGRYFVTDRVYLEGQTRNDLNDDGRTLFASAALGYEHDCYKATFTAKRRGFTNRNVPPSTDFLFNLELLTLGRALD